MKSMFLPVAALALISLAGCNDAPDNGAAASVQSQPDGSTTVQIHVPESMAPAAEAAANPGETFENLRNQAGQMTDQAKQDAVVNARNLAEAGARALGQTEAEIKEAGDVAERSAQDALGLR